jgi:4-methyl-5(b-hydroxyethyl)-thiazole monophosphate biosynthesis
MTADSEKRVLVLLFDGVEEIEAIAPIDLLRRAGLETITASLSSSHQVVGRSGIEITADVLLSDLQSETFDVLFLPGGPGVLQLLENEAILDLIREFEDSNRWIAAICAAPKILASAGVLDDKPSTGHASVRADLPRPSDDAIVVADRVITSQGAGTTIPFALELIGRVESEESARAVAASIHF